jgi:hypothetical protein
MGSSNDDIPSQKQNISIGNAIRILNEHPIYSTQVLFENEKFSPTVFFSNGTKSSYLRIFYEM